MEASDRGGLPIVDDHDDLAEVVQAACCTTSEIGSLMLADSQLCGRCGIDGLVVKETRTCCCA